MSKKKKKTTPRVTAKIIKIKKQISQVDAAASSSSETNPDIISPPYDPKKLYTTYEDSSLLAPNITAMEANVDGLGYRIEPQVDLTANNSLELVRNALYEDAILNAEYELEETKKSFLVKFLESKKIKIKKGKLIRKEDNEVEDISPESFTEEEVVAARDNLLGQYLLERIRGDAFFRNCTLDMSFTRLRKETRRDKEVTGNAYWEVLRDGNLKLKRFKRIHPSLVRITRLSKEPKAVKRYERVSQLTTREVIVKKYVRSYAIEDGGTTIWMKEFGVQEIISSKTGKYFKDIAAFKAWKKERNEELDVPGHEILHFKLSSNSVGPYGVPRWIGALTEVMGSRGASEYNQRTFTKGFLDPKILTVNGGTLTPESHQQLEDFIGGMKGVENSHRLLILEATGATGQAVPQVEIKDVKNIKSDSDAGWLKYDARNEDKVGSQFRIPQIIRGVTDGQYNRATSDNAMKQADEQVFGPERKEFDWEMSRIILPEIGLSMSEFVSNGLDSTDTELMGELIKEFVDIGILTPKEGRELAEDIFNHQFPSIEEEWVNYPLKVLLSGVISGGKIVSPEAGIITGDKELSEAEKTLQNDIVELLAKSKKLSVLAQGIKARKISEAK